jgi:hypothetical protein
MKNFSGRKGLKPVSETIQIDSMNDELRNSLWNTLDITLWSTKNFLYSDYGSTGHIESFSRTLWFSYFKKPIDSRPNTSEQILTEIRRYFFGCRWNAVYDFIEFVVGAEKETKPRLAEFLNFILERELSGFRFASDQLVDVTNPQEIEVLEEALRDTRFAGVSGHLQRALERYADRDNPDDRNAIKESISTVESMAQEAAGKPKATLPEALKAVESKGSLHPALKEGSSNCTGTRATNKASATQCSTNPTSRRPMLGSSYFLALLS